MATVNVIKLVLLGVLTVRDLNKQCYGHDGRLKGMHSAPYLLLANIREMFLIIFPYWLILGI